MDKCLICLSECYQYMKLYSCSCKMILHEDCFLQYISSIKTVKCIICNKEYSHINKSCFITNNILSSVIYGLFFILQNFYFYIDEKIFPQRSLIIRTIFAVVFHCILLLLIMIPYALYLYTEYFFRVIFKRNIKPYKVYNL